MKLPKTLLTIILVILISTIIVPVSRASRPSSIEQTSTPTPTITLAIMGDSNEDEYRADDNRGGDYGTTTLNWVEQLVDYRNVDLGKFAKWGGFRRTGYEYNFARSGATTASGLEADVPKALAALVESGKAPFVYYALGTNDMSAYILQIYSGSLAGDALDADIQKIVTNTTTALDTINASHKAKILVSLVPDITLSPFVPSALPDPAKVKRLADAYRKLNDEITLAVSQRGYGLFDVNVMGRNILGSLEAQENFSVGGEKFIFDVGGNEPHHILLADGEHTGTVISAIYANEWMKAANATFGTDLQPFTDAELLDHAGIKVEEVTPTPAPKSLLTGAQSLLQKLFGIKAP